jgi:hypothetical protein
VVLRASGANGWPASPSHRAEIVLTFPYGSSRVGAFFPDGSGVISGSSDKR